MHNKKRKIAIVYDWIDKWGGVERLLLHFHSLFPEAHFFTSAVEYKNAQWARDLTIHTSFIQSLPAGVRSQRALILPLYPLAFESFQFDEYDLVISITSAFAKSIITKPGTTHICYLLTPPRYLWSHMRDYVSKGIESIGKPFFTHWRAWDVCASRRPDAYISLSKTTAARALQFYGVSSSVVYPPFDTGYWDKQMEHMKKPAHISFDNPYYLSVGRMESYKKVELIIEAAKISPDRHFVFVGTGTLETHLKRSAPQNCQFAGVVSDNELSYLYAHAKGFIMPQNEDFGYVSLEAQYHGCPVLAFRGGGACETVLEGKTGIFFDEQNVPNLVSQLERFEQISYNLIHSTRAGNRELKKTFGIERFNAQFTYQLQKHISL